MPLQHATCHQGCVNFNQNNNNNNNKVLKSRGIYILHLSKKQTQRQWHKNKSWPPNWLTFLFPRFSFDQRKLRINHPFLAFKISIVKEPLN
jgi:hypothetical protein